MSILVELVPLALALALYAWYLRLAARWTARVSLNRKLVWIFIGSVLLVTVAVRTILPATGLHLGALAGATLHLAFGTWYFGRFIVGADRRPLGYLVGLKLTALAMAMLLATSGAVAALVVLVAG